MVIITDSSCDANGFRYGLTCVLRQAGIFVLWLVCKKGAKAKDLSVAWDKAPPADIGLTIYNGNDVTTNWMWDDSIGDDIRDLVNAASRKCGKQSLFFVNHAAFYPDLRPDCYPNLMSQVRAVIRTAGADVCDGASYVGKIKMRDQMHFAVESTESVVQMYSEVAIRSIQTQQKARRKVVDEEARRKADKEANRRAEEPQARHTAEEEEEKEEEEEEEEEEAQFTVEVAVEEARRKAEDEANRRAEETEARRTAEAAKRKDEVEAQRRAEEEEKAHLKVHAFLTDARRIAEKRKANLKEGQLPVEPKIQIPPLSTKRPRYLPEGDDRFNKVKVRRTYGCDSCGNLVSFSSWKRHTGERAKGEFQGSYKDNSWAGNVPGELIVRAYNEGLIDCTWQCTQFCDASPTGVKDRTSRPEQWRKTHQGGAGSGGPSSSKWR
jgi:hypothetical protein